MKTYGKMRWLAGIVTLGMMVLLICSAMPSLGVVSIEENSPISLATGKEVYALGETVDLVMTNTGEAELTSGLPRLWVTDETGEVVYDQRDDMFIEIALMLKPGDTYDLTWDQSSEEDLSTGDPGPQVPAGNYDIHVEFGGYKADCSIAIDSDPLEGVVMDLLEPNGGEEVSGTIDISWEFSLTEGTNPMDGAGWTFELYRSYGITSENGVVSSNDPTNPQWILIDTLTYNPTTGPSSEPYPSPYAWDTTTVSDAMYEVKVVGMISGYQGEDQSDSLFTVRNNPVESISLVAGKELYKTGETVDLVMTNTGDTELTGGLPPLWVTDEAGNVVYDGRDDEVPMIALILKPGDTYALTWDQTLETEDTSTGTRKSSGGRVEGSDPATGTVESTDVDYYTIHVSFAGLEAFTKIGIQNEIPDPEGSISLVAGKDIYALGETVDLVMTNTGEAELTGGLPALWVIDEAGKVVYDQRDDIVIMIALILKPGDTYALTWDQSSEEDLSTGDPGPQVPAGNYDIHVEFGGYKADCSIAIDSDPLEGVVMDLLEPNGGEEVSGTIDISWEFSLTEGTNPMDGAGWTFELYRSYGITSENGVVSSNDPTNPQWILIDTLTYNPTTGPSSEPYPSPYAWDTTTVSDAMYEVKVVGMISGYQGADQSDSLFTVNNDPSTTVGPISLEADKDIYKSAETVNLVLTNTGEAELTDGLPRLWVTDETGNVVYDGRDDVYIEIALILKPGDTYDLTWDQTMETEDTSTGTRESSEGSVEGSDPATGTVESNEVDYYNIHVSFAKLEAFTKIGIQKETPDPEGSISLVAGKDIYAPGETVDLVLTNTGDTELTGGLPALWVIDEAGKVVYDQRDDVFIEIALILKPGDTYDLTWDQSYDILLTDTLETESDGSTSEDDHLLSGVSIYSIHVTFAKVETATSIKVDNNAANDDETNDDDTDDPGSSDPDTDTSDPLIKDIVEDAKEDGRVVAEVDKDGQIKSKADDNVVVKPLVVEDDSVSYKVNAEFNQGMLMVFILDKDKFGSMDNIRALFDGEEMARRDANILQDALNDHENGDPLWSVEETENGLEVLVLIPHFSEHIISFERVVGMTVAGENDENTISPLSLMTLGIVAVLILVLVTFLYMKNTRSKKEEYYKDFTRYDDRVNQPQPSQRNWDETYKRMKR